MIIALASISLAGLHAVQGIAQSATGSLIAAVWQGVALAALVTVGLRLAPRTPAAVRFAIWFAVFALVVLLPVVSLRGQAAGGVGVGRPWMMLDWRWSAAIAAIWAAASLVRAVTLAVAAFRVRELWRRARPVEVASAARPLNPGGGLTRAARICTSDEVDRPSVIGFFSPKILIPTWLIEKLTPVELEQIVLHEAGHLRRADDWMNLLQKIALVVFPLNPALAWIERRLCFERELACDERVLQETGAPKAYAECLAALAELRMKRRGVALNLALGFAGAFRGESELGRRVGRILGRGESMRRAHARIIFGGAMVVLLAGAMEFSRCPQVVGFSSGQAQVMAQSSLDESVPVAGVSGRFAMRPVVFHPAAQRRFVRAARVSGGSWAASGLGVAQRQPTLRDGAAQDGPPRMGAAQTQPTFRDVEVKARPLSVGSQDTAASPQPRPTTTQVESRQRQTFQWVVVTSFDSASGSRLVFATASSATPSDSGANLQPAADNQAEAWPSQAHPYAAVPVRGGWLVFQL